MKTIIEIFCGTLVLVVIVCILAMIISGFMKEYELVDLFHTIGRYTCISAITLKIIHSFIECSEFIKKIKP